jgi:hypothetical protein
MANMTTAVLSPPIGWDDAIESILQFEEDIDDDFSFGLKGFLALDEELRSNIFGFVKVGICADRIRRFKLWESAKCDNFKDYCRNFLGKSTWYINRLIDAAQVIRLLIDAGFKYLPQCEAQARPLVKFLNGACAIDNIAIAWQKVLDNCSPDRITADRVLAIVNGEPEPEPERKIKVPRSTYEQIAHHAANAGMGVQEFIINMFDNSEGSGEPEPEPEESDLEPIPQTIADASDRAVIGSEEVILTPDRTPKPKRNKGFGQLLFGRKEKPK